MSSGRSSIRRIAPMAHWMRATKTAVVLIALIAVGFVLAAPLVRGLVLIALLLTIIAAIFLAVGRRVRRNRSSFVPWVVSLVVSAVVTVPQLAMEHYKSLIAHVLFGLIWWVVLAAILRLVIFLADYFRRRRNGLGANA